MRGKHVLAVAAVVDFRITPADAGKTHKSRQQEFFAQDHPRGCGENRGFTVAAVVNIGSPPRMRGKPRFVEAEFCEQGITPADAGKTKQRLRHG